MNAPQSSNNLDPVTEIRQTVRYWYEQGATARALERMLSIDPTKINAWAAAGDWYRPEKALFRYKQTDAEDDLLQDDNHPRHAIKRCCQALLDWGQSINEIHHETGVKERLLRQWFAPEVSQHIPNKATLDVILETRMETLLTDGELTNDKLDMLERISALHYRFMRAHGRAATNIKPDKKTVRLYAPEGTEPVEGQIATGGDETNPKPDKPKRRKANDISHVTVELLDELRDTMLYGYQRRWYDNKDQRSRFILKSRKIGATWYFAWEALDDAIRNGMDQVFISASRDQALYFREFIVAFGLEKFQVELKGSFCIALSNGAKLRFLATNAATAQTFGGNIYMDEVFWIPKFKDLKKVSSAIATHKKYRKTYFSTPSAMSHDAYAIWSGSLYAASHNISDFAIDTSHEAVAGGSLGADRIWRDMVTIEDAQAQGCDLFDIDDLRAEYSPNDFANLFMCKFIDDSQSVFKLNDLMNCVVEAEDWSDYKPQMERPFANRAVAFGFDPSRTRDNASLAILEIPQNYSKPFRVLDLHSFHGQNVQRQSGQIKELVDSHTVRHLGIDTTGIGSGVFDLVSDFYPMATPIHYSPQMKNMLVVKMLDLITNGRFKYLSSQHEITRAFMMITQTTTSSGQICYASSRSPNAGHADVAWAIAHACLAEDINVNRQGTRVITSD
jgi:phage FluMu gp28-like protein